MTRLLFLLAFSITLIVGPATAQIQWAATNGPPGGACTSVCFDSGGRLFIGTEAGGVFESSNLGDKWYPRNAGLQTFHMHEVQANKNGYIFAVTYDHGVSRWFRDDQPKWTLLDTTLTLGAINSLSCAPNGHLFAATSLYGILRSRDNGDTWARPDTGIDPKDRHMTLVLAANGGIIALGSHLDSSRHTVYSIYNSTNEGDNWSILAPVPSTAQPTAFLTLPHDIIFVGDADGKLFRTTNNGLDWQMVYQDSGKSGIYNVVESPANQNLFLRTNYGNLYRSLDSGFTWSIRSEDTIGGSIYATAISKSGVIMVGTDYEGMVRSTDDGSTFTAVNKELAATLVYNLAVDKRGMLYAAVEDLVWRTADRGQTWTRLNIETGEVLTLPSLAVDSSNIVYLGRLDGVWVSRDSGDTWSHTLESGIPQVDNQCYQIEVSPSGRAFAATQLGLFQSTNYGRTWQPDTFGFPKAVTKCVVIGQDGNIYAEALEVLYHSTNDGFSWSAIGSSAGLVAESKNATFFAVTRDFSRSNDSGQHWTTLPVPNATHPRTLFSVYLDSHGTLFASTDSGIYLSKNNGDTWSEVSDGFQDPTALRLSYATRVAEDPRNGIYYAASRGQGVFLGIPERNAVRQDILSNSVLSCSPNPFIASTMLSYSLKEAGNVAIELRNTLGEIVWSRTIGNEEAGAHSITIEPKAVPSGNYLCTVRAGSTTSSMWITSIH